VGIREQLSQLVRESGMTRAEIARRVGEDPTWVSSRVRGSTEIKGDDIPRLASALGVSARAFFQASPEESPVLSDSRLVRDRLRDLLRQRGWTQSELARRLGKHRVWVHYRIKGATEIKADEIPMLAEALGVPPHAFFEATPSEITGAPVAGPTDPLAEPEREFLLGLLDLLDRYRQRMGSNAADSVDGDPMPREQATSVAVELVAR
jgi:transcriptional regulator with XRE-family HTH domain